MPVNQIIIVHLILSKKYRSLMGKVTKFNCFTCINCLQVKWRIHYKTKSFCPIFSKLFWFSAIIAFKHTQLWSFVSFVSSWYLCNDNPDSSGSDRLRQLKISESVKCFSRKIIFRLGKNNRKEAIFGTPRAYPFKYNKKKKMHL